jgi:hypothetical protein
MNAHVSDLFFNLDHDSAKQYVFQQGRRMFAGFDRDILLENANWFVEALGNLGVNDLPSPNRLVDDFLNRI